MDRQRPGFQRPYNSNCSLSLEQFKTKPLTIISAPVSIPWHRRLRLATKSKEELPMDQPIVIELHAIHFIVLSHLATQAGLEYLRYIGKLASPGGIFAHLIWPEATLLKILLFPLFYFRRKAKTTTSTTTAIPPCPPFCNICKDTGFRKINNNPAPCGCTYVRKWRKRT